MTAAKISFFILLGSDKRGEIARFRRGYMPVDGLVVLLPRARLLLFYAASYMAEPTGNVSMTSNAAAMMAMRIMASAG
jgi:hypothetical protein